MPLSKKSDKSGELTPEMHHCSQCNRPHSHKVFEHPDGVTMQCPCGYEFVDVRITEATTIDLGADMNGE